MLVNKDYHKADDLWRAKSVLKPLNNVVAQMLLYKLSRHEPSISSYAHLQHQVT